MNKNGTTGASHVIIKLKIKILIHSLHFIHSFLKFKSNTFDLILELKWTHEMIYYNSISRQSGIVHKDKAMGQLDYYITI